MSKSINAALLSAFIFPGAGHFYLKKRVAGYVLAGTAVVSAYLIISRAVEKALQITDKIQQGGVELDVAAIAELVSNQPVGTEAELLNIAWILLTVSWLSGIVDSYRLGRASDKGTKN